MEKMQNGQVIKYLISIAHFDNLPNAEEEKLNKKKKELILKIESQNSQIDDLERKYLSKIAKLLVMTQVHCGIKTYINDQFDQLGVSIKKIENEKLIEIDEDNQSFNNHENQNSNIDNREMLKE